MEGDLGTLSPEQIINGGEEEELGEQCDEEFYEQIEAPKFVDFTAPERRRPDEDCYWFCMRVGCDRKHEEEIDPEAIYKNFVLRVMAARSPNVRFGRALQRKALSTNPKYPQTAPPKSSRPRASRFSISRKMVKPLTRLSTTPKVKANGSGFGGKALTTPRNRKRVSNPRPFQSVRKPNGLDVGLVKSKVVAKALVFHSPKKAVRLKASLEFSTPLRKVKPDGPGFGGKALTTPRNRSRVSNPRPFQSVRKPNGLDDVGLAKNKVVAKALVFHSPKKALRLKASLELSTPLRKICSGMKKLEITSQKKQVLERNKALALDVSKKKLGGREVKSRFFDSLHCKAQDAKEERKECESGPCEHDCSDMEIDEKSRKGSLDVHNAGTVPEKSLTDSKTLEPVSENSAEAISNDSGASYSMNSRAEEEKIQEGRNGDDHDEEDGEKKTGSASDIKENHDGVVESDDKENASAPDANREHDQSRSTVLGKQKSSKCTQKVTQVLGKKMKDTTNSAAKEVQVVKYRKPKPTNPKPFRLRTDERRILKEANMEKKLHLQPLKEISTVTRIISRRTDERRILKETDIEKKLHLQHLKEITTVTRIISRRKQTDKEVNVIGKRAKPPLMKQPARPQGFSELAMPQSETSKTTVKPKKATMKLSEKGTIVPATKAPPSSTCRSLPQGRKRPAIPKEPSIHSSHVPKNNTKEIS